MSLSLSPGPEAVLPPDNTYAIQAGGELFRLSGFSLNSDAPSYFTAHFSRDPSATLILDRCPSVFRLIVQHLQGYAVNVDDETQFTALFSDALYFSLPRLQTLLRTSDYHYTCVGGVHFKLPKHLVSEPGNTPNYFDVTSGSVFQDLERVFRSKNLARPPPLSPPYVSRSPEYFAQLISLLQGGALDLAPCARRSLILECRYYRFLRLEQQLVPCRLSWNPFSRTPEVFLDLVDVKSAGVSLPDHPLSVAATPAEPVAKKPRTAFTTVQYKRPFIDAESPSRDLKFQMDFPHEATVFYAGDSKEFYVSLSAQLLEKFCFVFRKFLSQLGIDIARFMRRTSSESSVLVFPAELTDCHLEVNKLPCKDLVSLLETPHAAERRPGHGSYSTSLVPAQSIQLVKSIWQLAIRGETVLMVASKIDAVSSIKCLNADLEFL
ncbi:LAQU0S25e00144g1_1 [Lachancea quebecensis]|uniref:LAQU0S25e00144g1_1 n=1 Tax=Lachancea quebecensis TaxID=1654605 RepID=A0A0N7MMG2_9SACH|nr:LAQU0S25e00144g1_1 [Lachancea quebecensis]